MPDRNRLILSIAHRPLPNELLDVLINETCAKSKHQLGSMESTSTMRDEENITNFIPTLHVLLTGSPKVTAPGKSFDDWETKWTSGERIFSKFISEMGLERFHRLPRSGEVRLNGKLVDVKKNDFEFSSDRGSVKEQLKKELRWIAINVLQHFNIYAKAPVSDAIILYPYYESQDSFDSDDDMNEKKMEKDEILSTMNEIFREEWSETNGPLGGVNVTIQMVTVPII